MDSKRRLIAVSIAALIALPLNATAQTPADVWRSFAQKLEVGTDMNVRLQNGQRFRATLVGARDDAVLLQPMTRVTVPVQAVPYEAIARLQRREDVGMNAGKAAAIGIGAGAATFLAIMAIVFAIVAD